MGIEWIWNTGLVVFWGMTLWVEIFCSMNILAFSWKNFLAGHPPFGLDLITLYYKLHNWLMYSLWMLLLYIMQQREHMKGIPRSELAIICLMNSNPPIPDISESYLDSLCEYHIHFLMRWLSPLIFSFSIWTSSYTFLIVQQICLRHAIRSLQLFLF